MINLLVGYMWLFVHRPFEVWPWLGELRIERVYMLVTIGCWAGASKSWTRNRLNVAILLLATSILLSALLTPYQGASAIAVENWFKLAVFYVLVMSSTRRRSQLETMIVAFVVIMGIYELHSLREYLAGRGAFRMGIWRMIGVDSSLGDPNSFSASILYGLPMIMPAYVKARCIWQRRSIIALLALGIICVLLTGSRTAFVALAFASVVAAMMTRYRWRIFAILVITGPVVWMNLSGELRTRYLTIIDPSLGPANAKQSADSRKEYFFKSLEIWKQYPLVGVGPLGFAHASGTGQQAHTLYGEVLAELGTLGAVALALLVYGFIANFRQARQLYHKSTPTETSTFCYLTVCATMASVLLLLFLGLGGHNIFRFTWVWYAAFSALALRFLQEEVELSQFRASGTWLHVIPPDSSWESRSAACPAASR